MYTIELFSTNLVIYVASTRHAVATPVRTVSSYNQMYGLVRDIGFNISLWITYVLNGDELGIPVTNSCNAYNEIEIRQIAS